MTGTTLASTMIDRVLLQRLLVGPASGDVLAHAAGHTRAAVWKRIEAMRAAGVAIEARGGDQGVSVSVAIEAANGPSGFAGDTPYRILGWDEVQALAAAEGVQIEREGERVRLDFPAVVAA